MERSREADVMGRIIDRLNALRGRTEWEDSQRLIDALGVVLEEDPLPGTPPLNVALCAIRRESVAKAFVAIIDERVLPVNHAEDNARILEFLKEFTGEE